MKKLIFGALALAMFTVTSCREEKAEAVEEIAKETAINESTTQEMNVEAEDSLEVNSAEVDSLQTETEVTPEAQIK
ncbi:hypothetical protein [Christiangramia sabulilitoris]|uniref:Uncharacterized protein n=1 Tax=Christiangramia sabulilitoris TaxID=2583991 RepID=A0A550I989_9FLAO|nr:hypothetical protein [Christiangramia sabulilitoris]TRO67539.1 hypothetical protein FGM01_06560 [Christiangramia sabulilitoris]